MRYDLQNYVQVFFLFMIVLCGCVTSAFPQSVHIDEDVGALEKRAIRSLTENIPGATYDIELDLISDNFKLNAQMSVAFDIARVCIKRSHRFMRGAATVYTNWEGPNYVILKDGVVLSRIGQFERSTILQRQESFPDVYRAKRAFWPQFVGTSVEGVWRMPERDPRGILQRSDRRATSITVEELVGVETKRVDYHLSPAGTLSVWYSPSQNGLIVKMLEQKNTANSVYESEVNVRLKEWADAVWFPERVTTIRRVGNEETSRETVVISSFSIGEPDERRGCPFDC